jgi:hypothetical protein
VKRVVYLVLAALVALMILAPSVALAQETQPKMEQTVTVEREATMPLPKSGGPTAGTAGAVLLPAAALLLGSGILVYAVVRRR